MAESNTTPSLDLKPNELDPESVLTTALADIASLGDLIALHETSGPDKYEATCRVLTTTHT